MKRLSPFIFSILFFSSGLFTQQFSQGQGFAIVASGGIASPVTLFKTQNVYNRFEPWLGLAAEYSLGLSYLTNALGEKHRIGATVNYRYNRANFSNSEFREPGGFVNDFRPLYTTAHFINISPEYHLYIGNSKYSGFLFGANVGVSFPLAVSTHAEEFTGRKIDTSTLDDDFRNFLIYSTGVSTYYLFRKIKCGVYGNYNISPSSNGAFQNAWSSGLSLGWFF